MTSARRNPGSREAWATGASGPSGREWSPQHAERHLESLERFGMKFGLERMRRLMTAMGSPQRRLEAIHVLGSNGKSSTARMTAAILGEHGLRTGVYLSPHLSSWAERIVVEGQELPPRAFARALQRAARAAARVERTLAPGERVTQFELLTAAALSELAERELDVAVVEAGLGGRYDATSVIDARVQVLTNVSLEHTRWLGPTVSAIAGEKLAVVAPGGVLVLGPDIDAEVVDMARRLGREREAEVRQAPDPLADAAAPLPPLRAHGLFQRRNFALAQATAAAYLQQRGMALAQPAVHIAAAKTSVPGRFEVIDDDPPTVLDAAHNPGGVAALGESLPAWREGRPLAAVVAVLEDKDAAGMLALLLPHCERVWFTAAHQGRGLPPGTLLSLASQMAFDRAEVLADPVAALTGAQQWARAEGRGGVVLATGSIYLVATLRRSLGSGHAQVRA